MHPDAGEAERAGTILGLEAAKTFLDIDTRTTVEREHWLTSVATFHLVRKEAVESVAPDRVGGREEVLVLPFLPLPDAAGARRILGDRKAALEAMLKQSADPDDVNPARYQVLWAESLVRAVEEKRSPQSVSVPVQALRINDAAVVGVAGELFIEVQLAIKKASPFGSTLVAAYSNGCVGYIPVAEAYPDGGYEVDHSYKGYRLLTAIAPGAAEKVAEAAIKMLRALAEEKDSQ